MKSIIVKTPEGQRLIHIKQTKTGVSVGALNDIAPLLITCIMDDNSRIIVRTERK